MLPKEKLPGAGGGPVPATMWNQGQTTGELSWQCSQKPSVSGRGLQTIGGMEGDCGQMCKKQHQRSSVSSHLAEDRVWKEVMGWADGVLKASPRRLGQKRLHCA